LPRLVEMRDKFAKDGLSVITVSLDEEAQSKEVQEKVRKLLESKKAVHFTNLILDEKLEVWQQKLKFDGPPSLYVFDKDGKLIKHFKDNFEFEDVEKLVGESIKK
jgi:peroxiredoxin